MSKNNIIGKKNNKSKKLKIKKEKIRIKIILILIVLLFSILVFRLAQVQLLMGEEFKHLSYLVSGDTVVDNAKRGTITSSDGVILANQSSAYSIWIDSNYLRKYLTDKKISLDAASIAIGKILNIDPSTIRMDLDLNSGFTWIKKKINYDERQKILKLSYDGLMVSEEADRYYPNNDIGGNLIGFVNSDNVGGAGVEATYNNILSGSNGLLKGEKDGHGNFIEDTMKVAKEKKDGDNIELTIDSRAQYIIDSEMAKIRTNLKPRWASISVVKVKTGEILGISDSNSYNPNKYEEVVDPSVFTTGYFQRSFEPGSIMKPLVVSAAMDVGAVTPDSKFYDPGAYIVDGYRIKCWIYPGSHGMESVSDIIKNSCNPGAVQINLTTAKKGRNIWFDYLKKFGINAVTGVGFSGEQVGLKPPNNANIYLATTSIGQGISSTAAQMTQALNVFGNSGKLIQLQLIKNITDVNGKVIQKFEPKVLRNVISKNVSDNTLAMMARVIENGTGLRGKLDNGVVTAGKTGTAQISDGNGKYLPNTYVLSFVGMGPYPDPQYLVSVYVDSPDNNGAHSESIGIYYKDVMTQILNLYSAIPQKETELQGKYVLPNVIGLPLSLGKKIIENIGGTANVQGSGYIGETSLPCGSTIPKNESVALAGKNILCGPNEVVVPGLIGDSLSDVIYKQSALGFKFTYKGSGKVKAQSIQPMKVIQKNQEIIIELGE